MSELEDEQWEQKNRSRPKRLRSSELRLRLVRYRRRPLHCKLISRGTEVDNHPCWNWLALLLRCRSLKMHVRLSTCWLLVAPAGDGCRCRARQEANWWGFRHADRSNQRSSS